MKKRIIIITIIALAALALYGIYSVYFKRTPEKILKLQFGINLKNFDYVIESFEEEWFPNGDGYLLLIINFNELTKENIDYFKSFYPQSLPISESEYVQITPNKIPKQFLHVNTGYYLYQPGKIRDMEKIVGIKGEIALDYKIFIVDIQKKTAILYFQIM